MTVVEVEFVPPDRPLVLASSMDAVGVAMTERSEVMWLSSQQLRESIKERFDTETDPSGVPWKSLSLSYQGETGKPARGVILKDTRELMEAATSVETVAVTNDTVFYRTEHLPHYGLAHEQGVAKRSGGWSGVNSGELPARPFLGLTEEAANKIELLFYEWFEGNIDLYPTSTGKLGTRHRIRGATGFVSRESVGLAPIPK